MPNERSHSSEDIAADAAEAYAMNKKMSRAARLRAEAATLEKEALEEGATTRKIYLHDKTVPESKSYLKGRQPETEADRLSFEGYVAFMIKHEQNIQSYERLTTLALTDSHTYSGGGAYKRENPTTAWQRWQTIERKGMDVGKKVRISDAVVNLVRDRGINYRVPYYFQETARIITIDSLCRLRFNIYKSKHSWFDPTYFEIDESPGPASDE